MSAYPLAALLSLRALRLEAADKAVQAAERAAAAAAAEEERRALELARWRLFRQEETERRWAALLGIGQTLGQLDDFRAGLGELSRQELALAEALEEAAQRTAARRAELAAARQARLALNQAKEKLERHRELWADEEAKEQQRLESLEMEEFARPSLVPSAEL
ncbi:MAG: YscO family type III secretion system apparatus protein [Deltaproteobacteria bacterium]|nr:YscO family type III secretion system apparatus protein [Deltaproteobacteria bacterium]